MDRGAWWATVLGVTESQTWLSDGACMHVFKLWCYRRLLRVLATAKGSNQSILKETNPEYSLEGLMLKLKLQYFGHLMWRTDSLEKSLMLGKIEGRRRRGRQRMRWLDGITDSVDMNLSRLGDSEGQGSLVCCSPWGCKESDMTEQLNNKQLLFISSLLAGEIIGVTIPQFFYLSSTDSLFYKLRFPYTHLCGNYFEIHRGRISKVNQLISKATSKNW